MTISLYNRVWSHRSRLGNQAIKTWPIIYPREPDGFLSQCCYRLYSVSWSTYVGDGRAGRGPASLPLGCLRKYNRGQYKCPWQPMNLDWFQLSSLIAPFPWWDAWLTVCPKKEWALFLLKFSQLIQTDLLWGRGEQLGFLPEEAWKNSSLDIEDPNNCSKCTGFMNIRWRRRTNILLTNRHHLWNHTGPLEAGGGLYKGDTRSWSGCRCRSSYSWSHRLGWSKCKDCRANVCDLKETWVPERIFF